MYMPVYAKIGQVLYGGDAKVHYIFLFTFTLHIGMTPSYSIIEMEKTY